MTQTEIWAQMIRAAEAVRGARVLSPYAEAGAVSAALRTESGAIYTGVCMDTACSLGVCAERSAAFAMITQGEQHITHLLCLMSDGQLGSPCGACREMLSQLDTRNSGMLILRSLDPLQTVTLADLMPADWKI